MNAILNAMRDLVQQDIGSRGLATVPGDNLLTACTDDFAAACRCLADHPAPHLLVVTGFPIVRADAPVAPETDGPLGAVFLQRALEPLGIRVTIAGEPSINPELPLGPTLPPFPQGVTHLLSIERVGPSWQDGNCYSMRGRDVTAWVSPVHTWFEADRPAGVVTLGIGDGGNELGMGKISRAVIARNIPRGDQIACRVPVDHLIVAGVSNWGAYALAAGIYHLRGQVPTTRVFDPTVEATILHLLIEEGLIDGKTGRAEPLVDGIPAPDYFAVLPALRTLIGGTV
jgi:hypothetical protein